MGGRFDVSRKHLREVALLTFRNSYDIFKKCDEVLGGANK